MLFPGSVIFRCFYEVCSTAARFTLFAVFSAYPGLPPLNAEDAASPGRDESYMKGGVCKLSMYALDTNLLVYAHNIDSPLHALARQFLESEFNRRDTHLDLQALL